MAKIGAQQSTLCYASNLNHYKTNKYVPMKHRKAYRQSTLVKMRDKNTRTYQCTIRQ